jgi:hypothetical protein
VCAALLMTQGLSSVEIAEQTVAGHALQLHRVTTLDPAGITDKALRRRGVVVDTMSRTRH